MSNLSAFPYITERAPAVPALWNDVYSILSANIKAVDSGVSTVGLGNFQQLSVGSTPPSYLTTAAITVAVNSAFSDYLYLTDSSGARSNYVIGSRAGGTADGLNIWDASGATMIVSFSKQSIRFFQPIVGPVFDTQGDFYDAATFIGSGSSLSGIQAAINQSSIDGKSGVLVPKSMYPFDGSKISFIYPRKMVREGGSWDVFDVLAYGASGNSGINDAPAIYAATQSAALHQETVHFPAGSYVVTSPVTFATGVRFFGEAFNISAGTTAATIVSRVAGGFTIVPPATGAPFNGAQFVNLKIVADTSANASIGGIDLTDCNAFVLDNVFMSTLDGTTHSNGEGVRFNYASSGGLYHVLNNVTIFRMGYGVRMVGGSTNMNWLNQIRISSCTTGIVLQGSHNILVGPDLELTTQGIVIGGGTGTGNHTLLGPNFDTVTLALTDSGASGSWVIGPTFTGVTTQLSGGFLSQIQELNMAWPNNDLTFSNSTMSTDASSGKFFRIVATNTSNFTVNNPINGKDGQELTYLMNNASGGALGTVSWGTQFQLAGAFVNPANGKYRSIHFQRYSSKWWELGRSGTDLG